MEKQCPQYKTKVAQDFFEKFGDDNPPMPVASEIDKKDPLTWTKYIAYGLNFFFLMMAMVTSILMIVVSSSPELVASSPGGSGAETDNSSAALIVLGIIAAFALGGLVTMVVMWQIDRRKAFQTK